MMNQTCHTYRDQGERCWLGQDTKHCKHSPMHPHSCNQTSNLLTCTRPSLLSGNCSPASCPSGKWPCRAALSNAPIYWEPKEHLSASSPCQPLSIAVGWPETPSPSSFWQEGPLTMRPTPGQRCAERPPTASVCLDTLWVRHAKGWFKQLGKSRSQSFALEAALGYHSNKHNKMNQLDTVESGEQSGQEMFLDIFSPTLARKNDTLNWKREKWWSMSYIQGTRWTCWLGQDTNAAYTAPLHPDSCNQTSNLLMCTRPSLLQWQLLTSKLPTWQVAMSRCLQQRTNLLRAQGAP